MKIILFDFDGVIVDTFAFCYRIIHERDSISVEEYRARFEGNVNDRTPKLAPSPVASRGVSFLEQYDFALRECPPNEEMIPVIQELSRMHPLIIISSTVSSSIHTYLVAQGLRDFFKEILGNDVEKSKIKKMQDVLQRYEIDPSEVVFVTDTLGDIKEASACNVRSIAVTWGYHPLETLKKGEPYRIVDQPKQLPDVIRSMG